ncbi:hypothetical protein [Erysipelothrix anatis]|nr:hypothetical protein [Erysipelothrix anatis]
MNIMQIKSRVYVYNASFAVLLLNVRNREVCDIEYKECGNSYVN